MPVCAHCGAVYPEGKLVCPDCGFDADAAWSDDTVPAEMDDPRMSAAEYEAFLKSEGLGEKPFRTGKCSLGLAIAVAGLVWLFLL